MKEENDHFDDAIRKKLREAKLQPPEDIFDNVVGQKGKKRRFLWLLPLLLPVWMLIRETPPFHSTESLPDHHTQNSSANNLKENSKLSQSGNSGKVDDHINKANTTPDLLTESEPAFSSNSNAENENTITGRTHILNSKTTAQKNSRGTFASKTKNNTKPSSYAFQNSKNKQQPSAGTYAYGNLPVETGPAQFHVYPVTLLPPGDYSLPINTTLHKPLTGLPEHQIKPSKYSIEFAISSAFPTLDENADSGDTMSVRLIAEKSGHRIISNGLNMEVSGIYSFGNQFSAGVGLGYSQFEEISDFIFTEYYTALDVDTNTYYILFPFTPPILVTDYDSSWISMTQLRNVSHQVKFKTGNIHLFARYSIPAGRFIIEPQLGATVSLFTIVTGAGNANPEFILRENEDIYTSKVELGLTGSLIACYAVSEQLGLFARTGYAAGLSPMADSPGLSTLSAQQFGAGVGVRWNFFDKQAAKSMPTGSDIVKQ